MSRSAKKKFLDLLRNLGEGWCAEQDFAQVTEELRRALLDYVSETPDNVETSQYLCYGKWDNKWGPSPSQGLILQIHGRPITDILHEAFGDSEVPKTVRAHYPKVTKEEWNQILRLANLVLMALEYDPTDEQVRDERLLS